jgi:hypothetical protein
MGTVLRVGVWGRATGHGSQVFCTCAITSAWSTRRRPESSSLRIERSIGRGWVFSSSAAVRRMDYKGTFVFLKNIWMRAFPYLSRRWLRACLSRRRMVRLCALKHAFTQSLRYGDGVVSSSSSGTSLRISASRVMIGGMPPFGGSVAW